MSRSPLLAADSSNLQQDQHFEGTEVLWCRNKCLAMFSFSSWDAWVNLCLRICFVCNPAVEDEIEALVGALRSWISVVLISFKMLDIYDVHQ